MNNSLHFRIALKQTSLDYIGCHSSLPMAELDEVGKE
jgi:hypothetical protein